MHEAPQPPAWRPNSGKSLLSPLPSLCRPSSWTGPGVLRSLERVIWALEGGGTRERPPRRTLGWSEILLSGSCQQPGEGGGPCPCVVTTATRLGKSAATWASKGLEGCGVPHPPRRAAAPGPEVPVERAKWWSLVGGDGLQLAKFARGLSSLPSCLSQG